MPQQFREFFARRGIDIDQHAIRLGETTHLKGVHGSGLGNVAGRNMPGRWNQRWQEFIDQNPNATAKDIYQQLGRMMDEFGLSQSTIRSYGQ